MQAGDEGGAVSCRAMARHAGRCESHRPMLVCTKYCSCADRMYCTRTATFHPPAPWQSPGPQQRGWQRGSGWHGCGCRVWQGGGAGWQQGCGAAGTMERGHLAIMQCRNDSPDALTGCCPWGPSPPPSPSPPPPGRWRGRCRRCRCWGGRGWRSAGGRGGRTAPSRKAPGSPPACCSCRHRILHWSSRGVEGRLVGWCGESGPLSCV